MTIINENTLAVALTGLDGWRGFEVEDGIGFIKASAFVNLPYEVDPERAPYATDIDWDGSSFRFIATPTKEVVSREWKKSNISPLNIIVAPLCTVEPDEVDAIYKTFAPLDSIVDGETVIGEMLYSITEPVSEDDSEVAYVIVALMPESGNFVSFGFSGIIGVDKMAAINCVKEYVQQISVNVSYSMILEIYGAAARASKSAKDIAFDIAVSGTFLGEGQTPVYPIRGLEDGWRVYFHNGHDVINSMLAVDNGENPSDIASRNRSKLFDLQHSDEEAVFGWSDNGIQFFLVPPDAKSLRGYSPLLVSVSVSKANVTLMTSDDYSTLHYSKEMEYPVVEVIKNAPVRSDMLEGIPQYDVGYAASIEGGVTIIAIATSHNPQHAEVYDRAMIQIVENIKDVVALRDAA